MSSASPGNPATSSTPAASQHAHEALRLVQIAPAQPLRVARQAVCPAQAQHDPAAQAVAERVLGLACTYVGDLDEAISHLRRSVALGRRAQAVVLVVEARMSLAARLCDELALSATFVEENLVVSIDGTAMIGGRLGSTSATRDPTVSTCFGMPMTCSTSATTRHWSF